MFHISRLTFFLLLCLTVIHGRVWQNGKSVAVPVIIGQKRCANEERKGDAMRKSLLWALVICVTLIACTKSIRGEFEASLDQYGELVRKGKMDLASSFTTDALWDEFSARARAAKNVRVVDYRVGRVKFDEQKGEAEVKVEIDYYTFAAYRLRTLVDTQKWAYVDEGGKKQWRLVSLLPEFK
jgi:hypothetical protein